MPKHLHCKPPCMQPLAFHLLQHQCGLPLEPVCWRRAIRRLAFQSAIQASLFAAQAASASLGSAPLWKRAPFGNLSCRAAHTQECKSLRAWYSSSAVHSALGGNGAQGMIVLTRQGKLSSCTCACTASLQCFIGKCHAGQIFHMSEIPHGTPLSSSRSCSC